MITLNLTEAQYEIIKIALMDYNFAVMETMDIFDPIEIEELPDGETLIFQQPNEAPYGLKKDGTPKARPGRKSTKKARKGRA